MGVPLEILFLHPFEVPCRYASWQRILNLGSCLAARGVPVRILTGPCDSDWDQILHDMAVASQPLLTRGAIEELSSLGAPAPGHRRVIVARGDPGARAIRAMSDGAGELVFEVHRAGGPYRGMVHRWTALRLERRATKRADLLLGVTPPVATAVAERNGYRGAVASVASGGPPPLPEVPADHNRDLDFLYVGKLRTRKGLSLLLRAMQIAGGNLTIVGGDADDISRWSGEAQRLGVATRVAFTGWLSPRQLEEYWIRARVGVCPLPIGESEISDRFTSPIKVLEMMARGLPIVGTDVVPLRRMLTSREARLVEADATSLAQGMDALLRDRTQAREYAQRALRKSEENTWEVRSVELLEALESIF